MKLKDLLNDIPYEVMQGDENFEISSISWDSRKVTTGSLFICVKGRNVDRHEYALEAVKAGASALIIEHEVMDIPKHIPVIKVNDTRLTMAHIANIYYKNPSSKFKLIGITGTNGKTSISLFIYEMLRTLNKNTGLIGTIENLINDKKLKTEKLNPTTPDSIELQASFDEMLKEEAEYVVMEVTSSALSQHRVAGCEFDIGVFSNLTQDHLEEHGTMENYKNAKMKLFNMCKKAVINSDDAVSKEIMERSNASIVTYGIEIDSDFKATNIEYSFKGTEFDLDFQNSLYRVRTRLLGKFNVYNILASIAVCHGLGFTLEEIIKAVSKVKSSAGRFEIVSVPRDYLVVVDYAHSPDSLEKIIKSTKALTKNKVIVVFGCGGDRDRSKRPIMAEIAGSLANICILTSDNPRSENPMDIINDIEKGIKNTHCSYFKIENRREAIHKALTLAEKGDAIIIAGKGHETYQILKDRTIHFSDVEVVEDFFK